MPELGRNSRRRSAHLHCKMAGRALVASRLPWHRRESCKDYAWTLTNRDGGVGRYLGTKGPGRALSRIPVTLKWGASTVIGRVIGPARLIRLLCVTFKGDECRGLKCVLIRIRHKPSCGQNGWLAVTICTNSLITTRERHSALFLPQTLRVSTCLAHL